MNRFAKCFTFSIAFSCFVLFSLNSKAQNVGIASGLITPDPSSMLEVQSGNKGLLIPRVALTITTSASPVTSPATSLLVYNTATVADVTPGYYYWNGAAWVRILSGVASNDWRLTGNAGTVAGTNFIGTTDAVDWVVKTNNAERMRVLSGGNVGIGTATPVRKLEVIGDIKLAYGYQIYFGENVSANGKIGINFHIDADPNYWIGKPAGAWTQPLHIGFYTGIKIGANNTYGGTKFYNSSDMATEIMSVGNGDNNVRVANYLFAQYLNSTDNVVGGGVTGVMVKAGDNYYRTGNAAAVKTFLNGNTNGWIENQYAGAQSANYWISGAGNVGRLEFGGTGGNSGNASHAYAIFQEGGAWAWPYPDLRIAYHTGISLGANPSYNGIRFFSDYDMSSLVMAVNDGSTSGAGNVYMSGTLGIGQANTGYRLTAAGDIYANGGWLRVSGTNGLYFQSYGSGFRQTDASWIYNYTPSTAVGLDINGAGNFGGYNAAYRARVGWYYGNEPNLTPNVGNWGYVGGVGEYWYQMYARYYNAADGYYYFSDKSLKENVRPIDNALIMVLQMDGVVYDVKKDSYLYNEKDPAGNYNKIGFIAQDFQKILPNAVREVETGVKSSLASDENKSEGTKLLTVEYTMAVPVLVEAIKEQQSIIESLKEQIELLNARLKVLENK